MKPVCVPSDKKSLKYELKSFSIQPDENFDVNKKKQISLTLYLTLCYSFVFDNSASYHIKEKLSENLIPAILTLSPNQKSYLFLYDTFFTMGYFAKAEVHRAKREITAITLNFHHD